MSDLFFCLRTLAFAASCSEPRFMVICTAQRLMSALLIWSCLTPALAFSLCLFFLPASGMLCLLVQLSQQEVKFTGRYSADSYTAYISGLGVEHCRFPRWLMPPNFEDLIPEIRTPTSDHRSLTFLCLPL